MCGFGISFRRMTDLPSCILSRDRRRLNLYSVCRYNGQPPVNQILMLTAQNIKEGHITFDGNRLFTRFHSALNTAEKPTIVFLHEALGSIAQWRDFPATLAEITGFNVFAYDRLGHGLSDAHSKEKDNTFLHHEAWTVLPFVLEQFQIRNPILWGHSDGGSIALLYASRFPTAALVIEAAHVFVETVTLEGIMSAQPRKEFLIERLSRYHGDKTEKLWNSWVDTWLDESFADWNIEALLPEIKCPALIIQGENDEYGTEEQVIRIAKGIGERAEVLMIPDCTHTPHRDAREIVLKAGVEFLNKYV